MQCIYYAYVIACARLAIVTEFLSYTEGVTGMIFAAVCGNFALVKDP
jgi:hypothetical protein